MDLMNASAESEAKSTPLLAVHRRLGARMVEFAGFLMPLSYAGIIPEHLAVRAQAGVFDLSHMGELMVEGEGATDLLEHALTNSVARLKVDQAQYTLICDEQGGVVDDIIVYRIADQRFLLCVNAANTAQDKAWLEALARAATVTIQDLSEATGLIAIQGPRALEILTPLTEFDLAACKRFHSAQCKVTGISCRIARTGYTGEDGFELFVEAQSAEALFNRLLEAGEGHGLRPCGLGARDTLRMEAGLALYGHELDRATTPLEAGLKSYVRFGRGFVGERALEKERRAGVRKRLIGLRTEDGRSLARPGYRIWRQGQPVGMVTSGTFAPSFECPLAMGYVDGAVQTQADARFDVEIRNKRVAAIATALPFYRRAKS